MADRLNDDPFFGTRIINFTDSVIHGSLKLAPISDFEKKILENKEQIKELNRQVDGKLVSLMENAQAFIPPTLSLRLMLYFKQIGRTLDGEKILYFCARDEMVLREKEIKELIQELRKDPEMNIDLWIAILGDDLEPEVAPAPRTGLNLPDDFH